MRSEVFNYEIRIVSLWMLRVSLSVVFVWFGALKLFDVSPIFDIIANAYPFIAESSALYFFLAILEIALGICILIPPIAVVAGWAMVAHLIFATTGVLVLPQAFLEGFPYLSTVGEFVIKNLVLIAGALVLISYKQTRE